MAPTANGSTPDEPTENGTGTKKAPRRRKTPLAASPAGGRSADQTKPPVEARPKARAKASTNGGSAARTVTSNGSSSNGSTAAHANGHHLDAPDATSVAAAV